MFLNALLHTGGSILTRSYSPGLVTGLLLWLPRGVFTLKRAWRDERSGRALRAGY